MQIRFLAFLAFIVLAPHATWGANDDSTLITGQLDSIGINLGSGKGPDFSLKISVLAPTGCTTTEFFPVYVDRVEDLVVDGTRLAEGDKVTFLVRNNYLSSGCVQNLHLADLIGFKIIEHGKGAPKGSDPGPSVDEHVPTPYPKGTDGIPWSKPANWKETQKSPPAQ